MARVPRTTRSPHYEITVTYLFVMDPAETMSPDKDTSFAFLRAADSINQPCLHALPGDVYWQGGKVWAHARPIIVSDSPPHVSLRDASSVPVADLDAVFIRKDPPFDENYLHLTQLLDLVVDSCLVLNRPTALQAANEKLYALRFAEWMPKTMVSANPDILLAFISDIGGDAVMKPLDGAGGSGILRVTPDGRNTRAVVDLLTSEGKTLAMAQAFEPAVIGGDKRVLLLDGQLLGAIRRVPRADDFRANIHVGGSVEATELTAKEAELVGLVGPQLAAEGLYFVGLDLIGEKLIEINVTSPTGIQELARLTGTDPAARVIQWTESKRLRSH